MVQYGREQRRIARKETEEQETEEEDYRLTVHQDRLCYIIRVVSRDNMPHTQSLRSTVQSLTPEHATERLTTKNKNNDKPRRFVSLPKMAKRTPNAQQQEQRSVKTICSMRKIKKRTVRLPSHLCNDLVHRIPIQIMIRQDGQRKRVFLRVLSDREQGIVPVPCDTLVDGE
jgi:hypothetical protein